MVSFSMTTDYASIFLNYDDAKKEKDFDILFDKIRNLGSLSNPNSINMHVNMFLSEKYIISSKLFNYLVDINFEILRCLVKIPDYENNEIYKYSAYLNKIFSTIKFKIRFCGEEIELTGGVWYMNNKNMIYDEIYVVILHEKLIQLLTNMCKPIMMRI